MQCAGQLAHSFRGVADQSKSPEAPWPTTVTLQSLSGECLKGISAGAAQHQYKHSSGDGEILLEMQQLISVGEVCVKQHSGCQTEQTKCCRRQARVPTDGNRDPGNQL